MESGIRNRNSTLGGYSDEIDGYATLGNTSSLPMAVGESQRETMIGPFVHLPRLNVVVCTHCKTAILADEVKTHLRQPRHRRSLTPKQRQEVSISILDIPNILTNQDDLVEWAFPSPDTEPIPYIEPPLGDGLGCNECGYVVRDLGRMQEHCRKEHGWINDWKKGGNVRYKKQLERPPPPWRCNVVCQRIFKFGARSSWCEVGRDGRH